MFRLFRKKDKSRQPQKMIVGLGNPGSEYSGTRHNIGFVTVDNLAKDTGIDLKTFKHNARFGQGAVVGDHEYVLRRDLVLAGGHNGHLSLIECLGTSDYPRVKIGIGRPEDETVEHVLSRFSQGEESQIERAVEKSWKTCEIWVGEGLDAALKFANTD